MSDNQPRPRVRINPWGVLAYALTAVVCAGGPAWVVAQWVSLWQ